MVCEMCGSNVHALNEIHYFDIIDEQLVKNFYEIKKNEIVKVSTKDYNLCNFNSTYLVIHMKR